MKISFGFRGPARALRVAIVAGLLAAGTPVRASVDPASEDGAQRPRRGAFTLQSPDTAQTYTDGHTIRYVLLWDARRGELLASLTFSNSPYVNWQNPRREEIFNFRLPGVSLDPTAGVFYARDARGRATPVAAYAHGGLEAGNIRPTVGTTVFVAKPEGQVRVSLTATPGSPARAARGAGHWQIDGVVSLL